MSTTERHCYGCKWSGMDMDMDPYCAQPKVLETSPYGRVLHRGIVECPSPKLPLFEERSEKR